MRHRIDRCTADARHHQSVFEVALEVLGTGGSRSDREVRQTRDRGLGPGRAPPATGVAVQVAAAFAIAQESFEYAVANEGHRCCLHTFVVVVEGAGEIGARGVVDDLQGRRRYGRAEQRRQRRCSVLRQIRFGHVAHRFVKEDTRGAGGKENRQPGAGWRGPRLGRHVLEKLFEPGGEHGVTPHRQQCR